MKLSLNICCFLALGLFSCRKEQNPVSLFKHTAVPEAGDLQSGDTVWFNNLSTGANRYYWDFGDGATSSSSAQSVAHVFTINDWVRVTLIAYGASSKSSNDEVFKVNAPAGHATFWFSPYSNFFPTVVTINAASDTIRQGTMPPSDCSGSPACAHFRLAPGLYRYMASELPPGHYAWSGSIFITQHGCVTEQLK